MFDLFRSRDKAIRILLGALLLLVALSMLTYLIPNYNTGSSSSDVVIAEIGKDLVVTQDEVRRLIQSGIRSKRIPAGLVSTMAPDIVDEVILDRVLVYEAERLGMKVSDSDIAQTIQIMVPSLFPDGKFAGREVYAGMLQQQGMTIADFENDIRRQMLVNRLRKLAAETVLVTPAEVEREYRRRNDKVTVEYVKMTAEKYAAEATPTVADMETSYKATMAAYQMPEKRKLNVLLGDPRKMDQGLTASDEELRRAYEQNKDTYRTPERVKARHILLKTTDKSEAEVAKIKARAEDLLKQLKAGGNFGDLAKKNSEDPGSAATGGELPGWVQRGQMVPEFEQACFSLKVNELSGLVKTVYGFHIVQVLQKEEPHLKPFEEAKAELFAEWKRRKVADMLSTAADKAQAELQKNPAQPDKVAAALGMQLITVDSYSIGDKIPEVGGVREVEDAILQLKKGEASPAIPVLGDKMAVVQVADLIPSRQATFAEAQDRIKAALIRTRMETIMAKHATELADKVKSLNGDLKAAAKALGLEVKTSAEFNRQGAVEGLGPAGFLQEAFNAPDGAVFGPVSFPDARAMVKVVSHTPANMAEFAGQKSGLRDELKNKKARERNSLFETGLRDALIKEGKLKIHQDTFNRLVGSFRG